MKKKRWRRAHTEDEGDSLAAHDNPGLRPVDLFRRHAEQQEIGVVRVKTAVAVHRMRIARNAGARHLGHDEHALLGRAYLALARRHKQTIKFFNQTRNETIRSPNMKTCRRRAAGNLHVRPRRHPHCVYRRRYHAVHGAAACARTSPRR